MKFVEPNSVDLIVTSPPYWDILWQKRTADGKDARPYSSLENDISNISDFDEFMTVLTEIFRKTYSVLKERKNIAIIVKDIRKGSTFVPFHIRVIDMMEKLVLNWIISSSGTDGRHTIISVFSAIRMYLSSTMCTNIFFTLRKRRVFKILTKNAILFILLL